LRKWQQIFKGSLHVTVVGVLPHVTINADILAGNAAKVTADSGKASRLIPMVGELRVADTFCVAVLGE